MRYLLLLGSFFISTHSFAVTANEACDDLSATYVGWGSGGPFTMTQTGCDRMKIHSDSAQDFIESDLSHACKTQIHDLDLPLDATIRPFCKNGDYSYSLRAYFSSYWCGDGEGIPANWWCGNGDGGKYPRRGSGLRFIVEIWSQKMGTGEIKRDNGYSVFKHGENTITVFHLDHLGTVASEYLYFRK